MPTLSPPNGQRRCAALPPSLHILHIWEYNYRLFPKQTRTACAALRRKPSGGISLRQPSLLQTGNAAVRRCPFGNLLCTPIPPKPCVAARRRASVKSKKNIIEKLPFSPLENKLETDKTYAPFSPKMDDAAQRRRPSEGV